MEWLFQTPINSENDLFLLGNSEPAVFLTRKIVVHTGDVVVQGQPLVELESDKIITEQLSPVAGVIKKVHIQHYQPVRYGDLLFEIEGHDAPFNPLPPHFIHT